MIDVQFEGLDDVLEALKDLEISEQKQRAVLSKCGDMVKNTVTNASPSVSGYIRNSIKKSNKKIDGAVGVEVKVNAWDASKMACLNRDVSVKAKLNYTGISDCCTGKQKSAGKLEDGTRLVWMFLDKYLKQ